MAQKVLILGESGTGKSASLRHMKPDEVYVINCAGKPLPFKNKFESVTPSFDTLTQDVLAAMLDAANKGKKQLIIDDAQYIMSFQYMRRIKENGWDKWNDIQGDFFNILNFCDDLPNDMIVYFLSHITRDDSGREKIKTMGKMLDEKITVEGMFTIVLKTIVSDGQYLFATQNSGHDTVKSPMGMFETYAINNDLYYVDCKIRNYYEIGDFASDSEIKKQDEAVAKPEVEKPDADGRKRRKRTTRKPVEKSTFDGETAEKEQAEKEARFEAAKEVNQALDDAKPKRTRRRKKRIEDEEVPFTMNGEEIN